MAERRGRLPGKFEEIFIDEDVADDSDDGELFEESDCDLSESTDEDEDPFYEECLSEVEVDSQLNIYENSDRIGLTDLSKNWSSDVKTIRQFSFSTDINGVIKANITETSTPKHSTKYLRKKLLK